MKTEAELAQLQQDLDPFRTLLGKAADTILDEDVSSYPIFIVHQQSIALGIPVVQRTDEGSSWSIHASTLEELATKQVIGMEKVDDFRKVYKDPAEYLCLFVLYAKEAQFIFLPR